MGDQNFILIPQSCWGVCWAHPSSSTSDRAMRGFGLFKTRLDIIMIRDDHYYPLRSWITTVL